MTLGNKKVSKISQSMSAFSNAIRMAENTFKCINKPSLIQFCAGDDDHV